MQDTVVQWYKKGHAENREALNALSANRRQRTQKIVFRDIVSANRKDGMANIGVRVRPTPNLLGGK